MTDAPSGLKPEEWPPKVVVELARSVVRDVASCFAFDGCERIVLAAFKKYGETVWTAQQLHDAEIEADAIVKALHPPEPKPAVTVEELAKFICANFFGMEYETLYANKTEWTNDRGSRHSLDIPYKADFLDGAKDFLAKFNVVMK